MSVQLVVTRRQTFEAGRAFGPAGAYERLDGLARFAVDPSAPANAAITDLQLAPVDADGRVRFEADFVVLRPADLARSRRRLLFQVVNRGRLAALPLSALSAPPPIEVSERIEPGDGFLLGRGWALAWCGWQWDVVRRPGILGLAAPEARLPEAERDGQVLVSFQPHVRATHHGLWHWPLDPPPGLPDQVHEPYRPADLDDPGAVLTVRMRPHAAATEIPRAAWRFAREEGGGVVADDTCVWLAGGFEPGNVYEVRYRPRRCPVVGSGLLAVRDFVACLRRGPDGPAGPVDHVFAFGISQSGRFLREFLHAGLNVDEAGRMVFDGIVPHVAGARRGEFNQRYGQPSVQHAPSVGHLPPFTDAGLLERQRRLGGVPRVFTINTSSEYWRSEASLLHVVDGEDVAPPAEVRTYLFSGCQHGPGVLPPSRSPAMSPWVRPANRLNTVDYTPLLRAALVNLERWVAEGVEPPPDAVPRLADGTAVDRAEVLARFAAAGADATLPRPGDLPALRRLDLGERTAEGVVRLPATAGEPYASVVSSVDADLNEEAGIRLPDLTVPLAAQTGWNPRRPESGGEGQLVDMLGSAIPLPGASIAARYEDRDHYCRLVRAEAERLVTARHLLEEDVERVVARAAAAYDAYTEPQPSA
jgi:Alpha/beta hydrolase domain